MSVIVEDSEGKLIMFCKGADSSVLPLCTEGTAYVKAETKSHIDSYAKVRVQPCLQKELYIFFPFLFLRIPKFFLV